MNNIKVYRVGGFVRDQIMGVSSKDLDFAVEASSYDAMVAWIKTQGKVYLEQPQFWTVRAHLKGKLPADYVLCRKDGQYTDGRRPDSVSVGTLADDLARRDFTMNAIAVDDSNENYIDPFNGREDIANGIIRCVGKAHDRFHEDALRLLRAIRFSITKGFKFHDHVEECLHDEELAARLAANVTEERKREELHRCFAANTPQTLQLLGRYPLICYAVFNGKMWLKPTMEDA